MRQIHRAPIAIVELPPRRAFAGAGLGKIFHIGPVVAQMKLPIEIEEQPFAWRTRSIGCCLEIKTRRSKEEDDEKRAEEFGCHKGKV